MAKHYKVVRTYNTDEKRELQKLQKIFDEGYELVKASEYVPPCKIGSYYGYIEYILVKEEKMTKPISPTEFKEEAIGILSSNDSYNSDEKKELIDQLMENLLIDLGYEEGIKVIRERW